MIGEEGLIEDALWGAYPIRPILDIKIPIQMESDLDTGRSPSPHKKGLRKKNALALRVFSII